MVTQRDRRRPAGKGDLNLAAAGLLYDMAALQPTERSQFGYKRAAKAIAGLPVQVDELVAAGALRAVPFVGPSSERIVVELVRTGESATVDAAIEKSGKRAAVEAKRALREGFLSHTALQAALTAPARKGTVSQADYHGDFQMHSSWSDGTESVATMAEACIELGHTCLGITDHSYGLPVARGMSMEAVERQHQEIDRLNAGYAGRFRIFKGIEANILGDGRLDLSAGECARFDFVVASPHSMLRGGDDQTPRMIGAVRAPFVSILGHPRGRMFNTRAGIAADWDRVFAEAAERRVAVEIDGNWHRQDLDPALARRAADAGCLFALDSDAHAVGELRFSTYAIALARLAGIPASRVINCWTARQLAAWMKEIRGAVSLPQPRGSSARGADARGGLR